MLEVIANGHRISSHNETLCNMASPPGDIFNQILSESDVELLQDQDLGRGAYGRVFKAWCAAKEIHSILIEAAYTPAERERLKENFTRECDHLVSLPRLPFFSILISYTSLEYIVLLNSHFQ